MTLPLCSHPAKLPALGRDTANRWDEAFGLLQIGRASTIEGDYPRAATCYEEALRILREIGARSLEMWMLFFIGFVCRCVGSYDRALEHFERVLRSPYTDGRIRAWAMAQKGLLLHDTGDDTQARECCERAVRMRGEGHPTGRAWMSIFLGHALAGLRCLAEAQEVYRASASQLRELGHYHRAIAAVSGLADVALASGRPAQALAYAEEVLGYPDAHPALEAIGELFRMYLTCCRVLRANEDPRVAELLSRAYRVLQEWAEKIEDQDLRQSFLENVAVNREIVREWEGTSQR